MNYFFLENIIFVFIFKYLIFWKLFQMYFILNMMYLKCIYKKKHYLKLTEVPMLKICSKSTSNT